MEFVQVDGEDISPTDVRKEKGWLEVRDKCKERKMLVGGTDPATQTVHTLANEETYVRRAARNMRRLNMTIKKPNLPVDDIKVIVRPRDGFQYRDTSCRSDRPQHTRRGRTEARGDKR
ncbi:hypothetical protein MTO96_045164 [Rhipicephalus appendiculatus]